jgi:2-phosphosulfolactate phosphatase
MYYDQLPYDIRCEWGLPGIEQLAPASDVVVIVDILSFSTCVDIAVSRGAVVYPYKWKGGPHEYDRSSIDAGAQLASQERSAARFSLSPASLTGIAPGTKLVLPSPNGSALSLATGIRPTLAGCFRNAKAIALAAQMLGTAILVVPAGERWADGSLRPAIEDLLGAGSIICHLNGKKSPEAQIAQAAFLSVESRLEATLRACSSGRELIERGFEQDVRLAAQLDASDTVPALRDGAYQHGSS